MEGGAGRPTILLAEDETGVGRTITGHLGDEGLEVRWVRTIREARVELREHPPDLLLLDTSLETDGLEFFQALRSLPEHPRGGVVVLAEERDVRTRERALQLGAAAVVTKPLRDESVRTTVRELVACL
jgi:DNA-binding response OmpR family regulator